MLNDSWFTSKRRVRNIERFRPDLKTVLLIVEHGEPLRERGVDGEEPVSAYLVTAAALTGIGKLEGVECAHRIRKEIRTAVDGVLGGALLELSHLSERRIV